MAYNVMGYIVMSYIVCQIQYVPAPPATLSISFPWSWNQNRFLLSTITFFFHLFIIIWHRIWFLLLTGTNRKRSIGQRVDDGQKMSKMVGHKPTFMPKRRFSGTRGLSLPIMQRVAMSAVPAVVHTLQPKSEHIWWSMLACICI